MFSGYHPSHLKVFVVVLSTSAEQYEMFSQSLPLSAEVFHSVLLFTEKEKEGRQVALQSMFRKKKMYNDCQFFCVL